MFRPPYNRIGISMLLYLSSILFVSVCLRIGITYLNADRHLTVPDFYYARDLVGRDFEFGAMKNATDFLSGRYDTRETYYGPAFAVALAGTFPFTGLTRSCTVLTSQTCTALYYRIAVIVSISILVLFTILVSRDTLTKIIGVLTISIFLTGIPGARGLETGNIDIILAPIFGCVIWLYMRTHARPDAPIFRYVLLGIVFGWLANTKIFLLPFACVALLFSLQKLPFFAGFAVSFFGNSVIPVLFGAHTSPADPFISSTKALTVFSKNLFVNYPGNNAVTTIATLPADLLFRTGSPAYLILTLCFTVLCLAVVFVLPFYKTGLRLRSVSALTWFAVCTVSISILPPVSFDYRLYFYLTFLLYCAGTITRSKSLALIYSGILLLLGKSLWIEHARLLNIFLILSCYCCIRATVRVKDSVFSALRELRPK